MTFCFVGTNPHLFETAKIGDIDNPVYLFAPKTYIPNLTLPETTRMLRRLGYFMGLNFDEDVISYLQSRYGGHPFFIRQIASHVNRKLSLQRPISVSLQSCREAERDAGADVRGYMADILTHLESFYPEELEMLQALARGDQAFVQEMVAFDPSFTEHLIGYGLIARRGEHFEFTSGAIAEIVRSEMGKSETDTLEAKWAELSRRRNPLEAEIRTSLYRWSAALTDLEWDTALSECLSKDRLLTMGGKSRREAFSRGSSPLYFLELMKFVKYSGAFHSSSYSQSDISEAMDIVNRYRVDAHSKYIDKEVFRRSKSALDLLENIFLPPP